MPAAVVLYEDSRGASPRDGFGPHRLALACVADDTGVDRWSLRDELVDNVRKGRDEVLKACRDQGAALSASALQIVAVLDDDRVREGLPLPLDACKAQVMDSVSKLWSGSRPLVLVLLERQMEDLVWYAARESGRPLPRPIPHSPSVRDPVLHAAAAHAERSVRDRIRAAMPSFDRLVRALVAAWRASQPA